MTDTTTISEHFSVEVWRDKLEMWEVVGKYSALSPAYTHCMDLYKTERCRIREVRTDVIQKITTTNYGKDK